LSQTGTRISQGGANHFFLFFDFQTLKRHSSTTIQSISKKKIVVIIGGLRWPEKNNSADSAISGQNITSIAKNRQFWALSKCPPLKFLRKNFFDKMKFFFP